jgi:hypothetical protein
MEQQELRSQGAKTRNDHQLSSIHFWAEVEDHTTNFAASSTF